LVAAGTKEKDIHLDVFFALLRNSRRTYSVDTF
jgi:hypothetical protein